MKEPIIDSLGNVFSDLGFDPAEAAILQMRAKLMNDLRDFIQSSGMTQVEATERFGIAQSRVSNLVRGKWEKFSLEMLISLEARAGRKVSLELAAGVVYPRLQKKTQRDIGHFTQGPSNPKGQAGLNMGHPKIQRAPPRVVRG